MRKLTQTRSRRNIFIAALVAAGIVSTASYFAISAYMPKTNRQVATGQMSSKNSAAFPAPAKKNYGLPLRLKIPKLGVDTSILYMGLTPAGDMEVPADLKNVGWYKYGPHPGDTGSAVIAGHLEGYEDRGVFKDLAMLQKGDAVTVTDDGGGTRRFAVRESKTYGQHERPSEVFQASDGAHLNLITCTGIWNESEKRYSQRLVVFTDKIK